MAQLAGMTLAERWADWHRRPFGHESTSHVSIWRKDVGPRPAESNRTRLLLSNPGDPGGFDCDE